RLRPGVRSAIAIAAVYSAVSFAILFGLGDKMALMFMDSATTPPELRLEVAALARRFLLCNSAGYLFLSLVNIVRFMIQGLGFTQQAIFAGIFEMVARCVIAFIVVDWFGYNAICVANPVAWIAADLFLIPAYFYDLKKLKRQLESKLHH
ncbi:MAG: MATE family efflux transporter, partial [Oscillibacter sp.]|nr:MATE family efflux transporter [Oscillibacter sp.]